MTYLVDCLKPKASHRVFGLLLTPSAVRFHEKRVDAVDSFFAFPDVGEAADGIVDDRRVDAGARVLTAPTATGATVE